MSTHIGAACRAAGLLPIAMAVKCTKLDRSGRAKIADFCHRLLSKGPTLQAVYSFPELLRYCLRQVFGDVSCLVLGMYGQEREAAEQIAVKAAGGRTMTFVVSESGNYSSHAVATHEQDQPSTETVLQFRKGLAAKLEGLCLAGRGEDPRLKTAGLVRPCRQAGYGRGSGRAPA